MRNFQAYHTCLLPPYLFSMNSINLIVIFLTLPFLYYFRLLFSLFNSGTYDLSSSIIILCSPSFNMLLGHILMILGMCCLMLLKVWEYQLIPLLLLDFQVSCSKFDFFFFYFFFCCQNLIFFADFIKQFYDVTSKHQIMLCLCSSIVVKLLLVCSQLNKKHSIQ